MKIIGHIQCGFQDKFGIPRQSGLVEEAEATVIFEPEYRVADAFRGLDEFSHIWILWAFHLAEREQWSPTVRPPVLGGNTRKGVFATRSPYRPNPIGLSVVRLKEVRLEGKDAPCLIVAGADMVDGTPVYDIKPYLPYVDSKPDATGGFTAYTVKRRAQVSFPEQYLVRLPSEIRQTVCALLAEDPRPAYQEDPERVYGMTYAGFNIRFRVADGILEVLDVGQ